MASENRFHFYFANSGLKKIALICNHVNFSNKNGKSLTGEKVLLVLFSFVSIFIPIFLFKIFLLQRCLTNFKFLFFLAPPNNGLFYARKLQFIILFCVCVPVCLHCNVRFSFGFLVVWWHQTPKDEVFGLFCYLKPAEKGLTEKIFAKATFHFVTLLLTDIT